MDVAQAHPAKALTVLDPRLIKVAILANPHAGASDSVAIVRELEASLQQRNFEPVVCWTREEFTGVLQTTGTEGLRCVVAAGGDGTLMEVLNRAPGVPVAILPLGTENLVARYWKLTRSGERLARIIEEGRVRTLDLAQSNGKTFCLMASAGFDADVVAGVHRLRRGHVTYLSYVGPIWQAVWSYRFPVIEVEIKETGERFRGAMVFVFNFPRYGGGLSIAPEADGADGLLDVVVLERPGVWNLVRYLFAVWRGTHRRLPDCQYRRVREVSLTAAAPVPFQADGDPEGTLPVTVCIRPQAMRLLVGH